MVDRFGYEGCFGSISVCGKVGEEGRVESILFGVDGLGFLVYFRRFVKED